MLSNNIWPVLTGFREKKQLFIDSPFTLLTVSDQLRCQSGDLRLTTSWSGEESDVVPIVIEVHCVSPIHLLHRAATVSWENSFTSSAFRASTIILCSKSVFTGKKLSCLFHFVSKDFCPNHIFPQENDTSSKLKIFHHMKDYMSASNLSSATSISIIPIIFDNATAKDQLGPGGVFWCWYRLAVAAIDF